jgi:hypothetical protein
MVQHHHREGTGVFLGHKPVNRRDHYAGRNRSMILSVSESLIWIVREILDQALSTMVSGSVLMAIDNRSINAMDEIFNMMVLANV